MTKKLNQLKVKGLLIHVTHYDPIWCMHKELERPFEAITAVDIVKAMAAVGMNLLIIDCADGVKYKSHPELQRHYTVEMSELRKVVAAARKHGIDVVPKLNFSKSNRNLHDMWMRPYWSGVAWDRIQDQYYSVAEDLIAELVAVCKPKRFFHIGMDEDHDRSLAQYVAAIKKLRGFVRTHGLRTVIWNDSCYDDFNILAQVHAEKCAAAEKLLPHDIVQVAWNYERPCPSVIKRIAGEGFEVWAAPSGKVERVKAWRKAVVANGGEGMLLTAWVKCNEANRSRLLELVETSGPLL